MDQWIRHSSHSNSWDPSEGRLLFFQSFGPRQRAQISICKWIPFHECQGNHLYWIRAASRCPWRGMPRQRLKMFNKKIEKYFEIYFLFYIGVFDVMKRWKNIWHFTLISLGCKISFISDVESFFFKKENFFRKKNSFCFNVFLWIFFQRWLMITVQRIWFHPFHSSFFDDKIRNECVQKKTFFQFLWFSLERY